MLEHVFGSKTRVKLLHLFLHHPDEHFYVRELTRRIDTQINAVRREIENLVRVGLLIERPRDGTDAESQRPGLKRKYYTTNQNFPLFQDMRSLLLKANIFLERKLDREILKLGDVKYLAFLGAFLGLRNQPVDVFIVGSVNEEKLKSLMEETGKRMELEINYSCLTPQEFKYRTEIADRFVSLILLAPKNIVCNRLEEKNPAR